MKTLVAKEIRLLLPAGAAALLLAVVPVWLLSQSRGPVGYNTLYPLCLGALLLSLSSFGREFGLRTFSLMLAQPLDRRRIWFAKMTTLAVAVATVIVAWSFACLRLQKTIWAGYPTPIEVMPVGAALAVAVVAGGLWTTLFLRQVAGAFWLSALVPALIGVLLSPASRWSFLFYVVLSIYSIGGIALARWQFFHAQEVGWTGGTVVMPGWRASAASAPAGRHWRPWMALVQKEILLHRPALFGMSAFFVLDLATVFLREKVGETTTNTVRTALEFLGGLWLFLPLFFSASSVADERGLGTHAVQLCQPISRRRQYLIKLAFALIIGGLISAFLCWFAEGIAVFNGARSGLAETGWFPELQSAFRQPALLKMSVIFLGLALVGFYGSTLAGSFVSAMAAAVVVLITLAVSFAAIRALCPRWLAGNLAQLFSIVAMAAGVLWSAGKNFRHISIDERFWRRNALTFVGALAGSIVLATGVYQRIWEFVTPLESAHGRARIALPASGALQPVGYFNRLVFSFPDGRLWSGWLEYRGGIVPFEWPDGSSFALGGRKVIEDNNFLPGSNWVSAASTYRSIVGIRADGSLWVSQAAGNVASQSPRHSQLVQFENDTNWSMANSDSWRGVLLLKRDGSIWNWWEPGDLLRPTNVLRPDLKPGIPERLGNDSDWSRMVKCVSFNFLWKTNETAWVLGFRPAGLAANNAPRPGVQVSSNFALTRLPALDHFLIQSLAQLGNRLVGVKDDGTLWTWTFVPGSWSLSTPTKLSGETGWIQVVFADRCLNALKSDGTIWQWPVGPRQVFDPGSESFAQSQPTLGQPKRLGTHQDWVGMDSVRRFPVWTLQTIAADGSVVEWQAQPARYDQFVQDLWIVPSRKPEFIGNIFAQAK